MTKRLKSLIGALVLGGFCLLGSILTILRDTDLDLNKTHIIIGQVTYAQVTSRYVSGMKFSKTQKIFHFRLKSSNQNFAIFSPNQTYFVLKDNVKEGDTIKVYYKPGSSDYNLNVYQVEKGDLILHDYSYYNKQSSTAAGVMLIAGMLIVVIAIISYTKFNVGIFLLRIVSSNPREQVKSNKVNKHE